MKVAEMREKRAALAAQAVEVASTDAEKFERLMCEVDKLKASIDRAERAEKLDAELRQTTRPPLESVGGEVRNEKQEKEHRKAFNEFLRSGQNSEEFRTYSPMSDGVEGAFVVPQGFQYELEVALKAYGGVREVARSISTAQGNPLKWPTANDTVTMGLLLGENTTAPQANPTFQNLTINAYTYTTQMVNVSNQLLNDSAFDVEAFLREAFVNRLGRITNLHFTQGTGSGQPMGINTAATAGPNPFTTSETTLVVSYNDLVNLEHSVDRAYRKGGKFMLGDSVLKSIKKLKDSLGRPLWVAGVGQNAPDTILGYPYVINTEMPAPVPGGSLMLFGALDKYLIRDVKELQVQRLSERFAELYQTAFIGFARFDGQLIDAGTHPVLALVSA